MGLNEGVELRMVLKTLYQPKEENLVVQVLKGDRGEK